MECPKRQQSNCDQRRTKLGCHLINHHVFYPRRLYATELEEEFRELPSNRVQMCWGAEVQLHRDYPNGPPKPTVELMLYCVGQERIKRELQDRKP